LLKTFQLLELLPCALRSKSSAY